MNQQDVIFLLDKVGILVFAFTGVTSGVKKQLDIFGLLVVGVSCAIGGGILRDLLVARIPYAISNIDYLVFAIIASLISIILFHFKVKIPKLMISFSDTLGVGVFAAAGAVIAIELNLSIFHTVLFSIVTASGGGIIKDVLINEIPLILKRDLYATSAGLGGVIIYLVYSVTLKIELAVMVGVISVILFRLLSQRNNWHLPIIKEN